MSPAPLHSLTRHETRWRGYVEAMRQGQTEALAQFYDETSRAIFGLALRILSNRSDAEEVVLDVYQQMWNSRHTFDPARGTVWDCVTSLTRNRAVERLRRSHQAYEMLLDRAEQADAGNTAAEDSIFQKERRQVLAAFELLTSEERQAIELSLFRGLTNTEIAAVLAVPLGTIKARVRVAMRRLREVLAPLSSSEGAN